MKSVVVNDPAKINLILMCGALKTLHEQVKDAKTKTAISEIRFNLERSLKIICI